MHPAVHEHPVSGRSSLWLHQGMTGEVNEKLPGEDGFRLLQAHELQRLCHEYIDLLTAGLEQGYAIGYEYQQHVHIFTDHLAVAHRASPEAYLQADDQGLRIMDHSTVRGFAAFTPQFGFPHHLDINEPSPFGEGVWQAGSIGFRWGDDIPMQN